MGSPFVLMLAGVGIGGAATLLNIVVLTAVLSVLNTMTYSNARMLHGMAEDGQARESPGPHQPHGVPIVALLVNAALVGVVVVLNYLIPGKLLMVLVAVILSAELIT